MAHGFVDGQQQVGRVQYEVVLARLDRGCLEFLARMPGRGNRILQHVVRIPVSNPTVGQCDLVPAAPIEVLVSHAHGRAQLTPAPELAAGLVHRRHIERCPDAVDVLIDVRAVGRGEVFLLVDLEQA
jgi:hypothetical protein